MSKQLDDEIKLNTQGNIDKTFEQLPSFKEKP